MPVSPARAAAFTILMRVERESAYAVELLHSALLDPISPADRNLTMEIVMGVQRWRSALDETFAGFLPRAVNKLDLEVLTALRMGAYQLAFLTRIPMHAVVNETVELVNQARKRSASGMVNAVMRKLKPTQNLDPSESSLTGLEYLTAALAHPEWLAKRWMENFGYDKTALICTYDQAIPATALRLSRIEDEEELVRSGMQLAPGVLMKNARRVKAGDVTATDLFRSGKVAIQDEGSQLVAALVGNGKRILDCCAAPGGKTAALATALPESEIVAAELHPHRTRLLRQMAPQENVQVITADALQLAFGADFDRVLADVPCSGTGTLARNPEIKWRLTQADIRDLQGRQIAILAAAMKHVAPGGRLIYSTCSLEPEENEQVVRACLQGTNEFKVVPVQDELLRLQELDVLKPGGVNQLVTGDWLRTIPGAQPCDGFFAAILERK
jgi:16S rRNA (cytosine967-C5)-methyltransferase